MQVGEAISLVMFTDEDDECPIDHASKDKVTGKAKKKKSVKELRTNMANGKSTQQWVKEGGEYKNGDNEATKDPAPDFGCGDDLPIKMDSESYPLSIAAHHIIPGKATLPETELREFIWKKENIIAGDIGYDVDGAENGVWLPTHAKLSRALGKQKSIIINDEENPGKTMNYRDLSKEEGPSQFGTFIDRYTYGAMELSKRQFHDSHSDYSDAVTKWLNKIKVRANARVAACDECKNIDDGKKPPPYYLVRRLNALSAILRTKLTSSPVKWRKPFVTSQYADQFGRDTYAFEKHRGLR